MNDAALEPRAGGERLAGPLVAAGVRPGPGQTPPRAQHRRPRREPRKNSDLFIAALSALFRRYRRLHVIVDNFGIHTSKRTRAFVETTAGRLVLHFLPPYAPSTIGSNASGSRSTTTSPATMVRHHRRTRQGSGRLPRGSLPVPGFHRKPEARVQLARCRFRNGYLVPPARSPATYDRASARLRGAPLGRIQLCFSSGLHPAPHPSVRFVGRHEDAHHHSSRCTSPACCPCGRRAPSWSSPFRAGCAQTQGAQSQGVRQPTTGPLAWNRHRGRAGRERSVLTKPLSRGVLL
ncbi:transposase [Sorangium cellulosum]|uniref:transposase n=1 Tax=Sorangium cellulosum TaxID=56 RepID=UPI003D9A3A4B